MKLLRSDNNMSAVTKSVSMILSSGKYQHKLAHFRWQLLLWDSCVCPHGTDSCLRRLIIWTSGFPSCRQLSLCCCKFCACKERFSCVLFPKKMQVFWRQNPVSLGSFPSLFSSQSRCVKEQVETDFLHALIVLEKVQIWKMLQTFQSPNRCGVLEGWKGV